MSRCCAVSWSDRYLDARIGGGDVGSCIGRVRSGQRGVGANENTAVVRPSRMSAKRGSTCAPCRWVFGVAAVAVGGGREAVDPVARRWIKHPGCRHRVERRLRGRNGIRRVARVFHSMSSGDCGMQRVRDRGLILLALRSVIAFPKEQGLARARRVDLLRDPDLFQGPHGHARCPVARLFDLDCGQCAPEQLRDASAKRCDGDCVVARTHVIVIEDLMCRRREV